MQRSAFLSMSVAFVLVLGISSEMAMAQYSGEVFFCTDGSSAAACRASEVHAGEDGVTVWDRAALGMIVCAGFGIVPQESDCNFSVSFWRFYICGKGPAFDQLPVVVTASDDAAVACSDTTSLPAGRHSARATDNDCFGGGSSCGNLTTVDP
ncbi:MAG: hypothetical protein HYR55_07490 [Acidobacteria bacterium]|nr:hypothetical protein [Acidobacteriota bacterium]MBI3655570.1 hypothetical protein [Acidobacteriota bacterium]